jgi:hypothetical protein
VTALLGSRSPGGDLLGKPWAVPKQLETSPTCVVLIDMAQYLGLGRCPVGPPSDAIRDECTLLLGHRQILDLRAGPITNGEPT